MRSERHADERAVFLVTLARLRLDPFGSERLRSLGTAS